MAATVRVRAKPLANRPEHGHALVRGVHIEHGEAMKSQMAARRGRASEDLASGIVAAFLFGACGSTVSDSSHDTCAASECQPRGGATADGDRTTSTSDGTSTTTSTTAANSDNQTSVDSRNVNDAGTVRDSFSPTMSAPLDGGQTCNDGTTCASSNAPVSESNTSSAATTQTDASVNDSGSVVTDATPSKGCELGNATPELYLSHFPAGTTITLPEVYDGSTPVPIVLALHASGMMREMETNFPAEHPLRKNFIVVTPTSQVSSGGFEAEKDKDFADLLSALKANLCFDTGRFFAIGHASGGRAAARQSTRAYQFRALAIVGAFSGPGLAMPTLFVHATEDDIGRSLFHDGDGSKAAARFATLNGCSSNTVASSIADNKDTADCVDYQDCTESLRWCRFEQVQTTSTAEYWPSFANDLIYDHFAPFLAATN